jgi:FkbM family methyltransferase
VVDAAAIDELKSDPAYRSLVWSLETYYGHPEQDAAMDEFYSRFVRPGDLVFDIGAHVGDRVGSFRRLGARVLAVEPQPLCLQALQTIYGDDEQVTLVEAVCGATMEKVKLHLSSATPTVATVSEDLMRSAKHAIEWKKVKWDSAIDVVSVTMDSLVAEYGVPSFAKIDVEGTEHAVLTGLSRPLPALSFEFTTIQREAALRCLDRLTALGFDRYDFSPKETMGLTFGDWQSRDEIATHLLGLPPASDYGDVYCLQP